jgi:hypothetical protein
MGARERYKTTALEKVEDGEAEQRRDDADVAPPVEAVAELNASIAVVLVC